MPCGFVVKKGSKICGKTVGADAHALVADGDHYIFRGQREPEMLGRLGPAVLGTQGDLASCGHGVAGVHRQIDQHLLGVRRVDAHAPQLWLQLQL